MKYKKGDVTELKGMEYYDFIIDSFDEFYDLVYCDEEYQKVSDEDIETYDKVSELITNIFRKK